MHIPKYVDIEIKEGLNELKSLRIREKNHRKKTRLQCLILTKEKKFKRRVDLATHLGIGIASLDRWTKVYKESGLTAMLDISSGGLRKHSSLEVIHKELEDKLNNSSDPLLGYWDAVSWVRDNFEIEIKYKSFLNLIGIIHS